MKGQCNSQAEPCRERILTLPPGCARLRAQQALISRREAGLVETEQQDKLKARYHKRRRLRLASNSHALWRGLRIDYDDEDEDPPSLKPRRGKRKMRGIERMATPIPPRPISPYFLSPKI